MSTSAMECQPEAGPVTNIPHAPGAAVDSDIRWFQELSVQDTLSAGGKGANLGELTRMGMRVPPGFVVTAAAFGRFLETSGLRPVVLDRLAGLNVDDGAALKAVADDLQQRVRQASIPEDLHQALVDAYRELARRTGQTEPFVAQLEPNSAYSRDYTSSCSLFRFSVPLLLKPLIQQERKQAQERLEQLAATFAAAGKKAVPQVRPDHPARGLLSAAEERQADLIVVGSHGLSALDRFLLGSVSEHVLRYGHCSVLVVKGSEEPSDSLVLKAEQVAAAKG